MSLEDTDFRGLHDVVADVLEAELLFALLGLVLYEGEAEALYLRDEPDEQGGVGHVEAGVEHGQHYGQTLYLTSTCGVVSCQ